MGRQEAIAYFVSCLIFIPLLFCIGAFIHSIFIRAAGKWVAKLDVPWGRAFATASICLLAGGAVGLVIGFVFAALGAASGGGRFAMQVAGLVAQSLSFIANFFVSSAILRWMLKVTYPRAMLVQLVVIALAIAIMVCIMIVVLPIAFLAMR